MEPTRRVEGGKPSGAAGGNGSVLPPVARRGRGTRFMSTLSRGQCSICGDQGPPRLVVPERHGQGRAQLPNIPEAPPFRCENLLPA
ncbi:unnamed protein product [Caretta caretta]